MSGGEALERARLSTGLREIGAGASEVAVNAMLEYVALVLAENRRTNLVGAHRTGEMIAQLLDALAPLANVELKDPVVDLGSGAGLPGLALAILQPERAIVLLEPRAKRAAFLRRAAAQLTAGLVEVAQVRAETAGRAGFRQRFGTVLARAVARPAVLFELALPLLKIGGELIVYLGKRPEPSTEELAVLGLLGGRLREAKSVSVPYSAAQRHMWIIRKTGLTPSQFPRRSGIPKLSPLTSADVPRGTKR